MGRWMSDQLRRQHFCLLNKYVFITNYVQVLFPSPTLVIYLYPSIHQSIYLSIYASVTFLCIILFTYIVVKVII